MRIAVLKTLTAATLGTVALLGGPAQAQPYFVPQGPVEYSPGYGYGEGPVEMDPFVDPGATGSVVILPEPTGPAPGETWIGYCSRKYPTYNRTSNTWWGPDGRQYLCR